LNNK
jgi:hypothetical protein